MEYNKQAVTLRGYPQPHTTCPYHLNSQLLATIVGPCAQAPARPCEVTQGEGRRVCTKFQDTPFIEQTLLVQANEFLVG